MRLLFDLLSVLLVMTVPTSFQEVSNDGKGVACADKVSGNVLPPVALRRHVCKELRFPKLTSKGKPDPVAVKEFNDGVENAIGEAMKPSSDAIADWTAQSALMIDESIKQNAAATKESIELTTNLTVPIVKMAAEYAKPYVEMTQKYLGWPAELAKAMADQQKNAQKL